MMKSAVLSLLSASRFLVVSSLFFRKESVQQRWSNVGTNSTSELTSASALSSTTTASPSSLFEDNDVSVKQQKDYKLDFQGEFHYTESFHQTEKACNEHVRHFFQKSNNRNLLIKGGDNPVERVPASAELYDTWEAQSRIVHSRIPDRTSDEDHILAVYTTVPLLPGLKIDAVSYTGVKLIQSPLTNLPIYEFTLIKEYYLPRGTRTMEWLFSRIAGNNQDGSEQYQYHIKGRQQYVSSPSRKTHGLTRVSLESDATTRTFRIKYDGHVGVSCSVPRRVLRYLPISKHAVEAKVSKSIVKQLKREGMASFRKYQQAWEEWLLSC
jgi:hypothetical protein